jgi:predicted PurR-regulated permease PerM
VHSLSALVAVPTNLILILFFGLYLAAQPRLYESGIVRLVPPARRARAAEVLDVIERTLAWGLVARFISMIAVGVLTGLALWGAGMRGLAAGHGARKFPTWACSDGWHWPPRSWRARASPSSSSGR